MEGKHLIHFPGENAVFKFLRFNVDGATEEVKMS